MRSTRTSWQLLASESPGVHCGPTSRLRKISRSAPAGFPEIRQDKEESKRLFEEVGLSEINFVAWDAPWTQPILASVQQQLKDVGVDAVLHMDRVADWSCALGRGDCGPDWKYNNQVSFNGAANPPEPSLHIAQRWLCPGVDSMGKWCNAEMDELALAATQTTDNDERARLYREWNQIFVDQVASHFLRTAAGLAR